MNVNASNSMSESQLRKLIPLLSSMMTKCNKHINALKNDEAYSRNPNHLESIHRFGGGAANINDTIVVLTAFQKAGMGERLTSAIFKDVGMNENSAAHIGNALKLKLSHLTTISIVSGLEAKPKLRRVWTSTE
jgi:hypothetical protein